MIVPPSSSVADHCRLTYPSSYPTHSWVPDLLAEGPQSVSCEVGKFVKNRGVPTCQLYSRSCVATFTGNRTAGCIANTCSTNTPWIQRNVLPSHVVVPIRVPSPSSTSIYDLYEQRGCPSCCPPSYRTKWSHEGLVPTSPTNAKVFRPRCAR
jgi:hypothetical protein